MNTVQENPINGDGERHGEMAATVARWRADYETRIAALERALEAALNAWPTGPAAALELARAEHEFLWLDHNDPPVWGLLPDRARAIKQRKAAAILKILARRTD